MLKISLSAPPGKGSQRSERHKILTDWPDVGVVYTDYLIHGERLKGEAVATYWRRMLEGLRPGVTELYIHAALPGEEMQAVTHSWQDRAAEFELFTNDASIRALLEQKKVQRIGYRALRDLQRARTR